MPVQDAPEVTPPRGDATGRGVVLTAAGPNMRGVLHDCSLPTFRRFAERWGYAVRAVELELDGVATDEAAQRAKWAKVSLLRRALREFPLVLWLDADVLVMRTDEDVADHLHPDHFQALALEHVPDEHRVNPNTGVWLLRSCRQAFDFLDAVEAAGQQPGPWADQGAVLAVLGWCRGDDAYHWARPGPGSPFLAGTSWLPPGWNQPHVDDRTNENCYNSSPESYANRPTVRRPQALHFMGMTAQARAHHMASHASAALATPADVTDPRFT